MKKLLGILLALILIFVAICGYFFLDMQGDIKGGKGSAEEITVEIPKGAGVNSVANILAKNGIIKNSFYFRLYAKQHPINNIQYGTFVFTPNMSYQELANGLQKVQDKLATVKLTFPEGTTLIRFAQIVEENGFCSQQEFIDVVEQTDWSQFRFFQYVEERADKPFKMEGFLFPDTYEFFPSDTSYKIAEKLLAHFDNMITEDIYAQIAKTGYSLQDIITLASYVQEEAGDPVNQPDVAAVFWNRLKEGSPYPKLESDVSWYYLYDFLQPYFGKDVYSNAAFETSTINTYYVAGIPSTPVSSPGIDAIKATLNPNPNIHQLFFLTDLTGKYYYADTYAQHLANIETMKAVNAGVKK